MKRYIARYSGKEGFEERYEVIDTSTGESVSGPLPYHQANDQAGRRNGGEYVSDPSAYITAILGSPQFALAPNLLSILQDEPDNG